MDELKLCPFCGGEVTLRYMKSMAYYRIECVFCDYVFRLGAGAKEQIPERLLIVWNRRTNTSQENENGKIH